MATLLSRTPDDSVPAWPGAKARLRREEEALAALIEATGSTRLRALLEAVREADVVGLIHLSDDDLGRASEACDRIPDLAAALAEELRDAIAYVEAL